MRSQTPPACIGDPDHGRLIRVGWLGSWSRSVSIMVADGVRRRLLASWSQRKSCASDEAGWPRILRSCRDPRGAAAPSHLKGQILCWAARLGPAPERRRSPACSAGAGRRRERGLAEEGSSAKPGRQPGRQGARSSLAAWAPPAVTGMVIMLARVSDREAGRASQPPRVSRCRTAPQPDCRTVITATSRQRLQRWSV